MSEKLEKILIASSGDSRKALTYSLSVAHLSYRISSEMHLLRSGIAVNTHGGYLALSDQMSTNMTGDIAGFCRELYDECTRRKYAGVIADFEKQQDTKLSQIIREAGEMLKKRGLILFVNEAYAPVSQDTNILIQTAISGGSLSQRLREAAERYGTERVSLDIERMRSDFNLSGKDNKSRHLTGEELSELLEKTAPIVFFSQELCAHYFTYKDEQGQSHFVLYDDINSINRKLDLGAQLLIKRAFFLFPEIEDILGDIK